MGDAAIIQAVSLLAPLLQRAVQGQLSAQALADLQALSERELAQKFNFHELHLADAFLKRVPLNPPLAAVFALQSLLRFFEPQ